MKKLFNSTRIVLVILSGVLLFASCHKEGTGGKSTVSGNVKHHSKLIPDAVVYIKYGATEFPGADLSKYDDHVTSDANAHYEFKDLRKGDYFLYGAGNDPAVGPVTGGIHIKLKYNEDSNTDVPVTE